MKTATFKQRREFVNIQSSSEREEVGGSGLKNMKVRWKQEKIQTLKEEQEHTNQIADESAEGPKDQRKHTWNQDPKDVVIP